MRAGLAAAATLVLLAVGWSRPALACSCVNGSLSRHTQPEDGSTGFPTDGKIRVFLTGGWPRAVAGGMAAEYRLREEGPGGPAAAASGAMVPLKGTLEGTLLTLTPGRPLRPGTVHRLERVWAYDTQGLLLDDDLRLGLSRREPARLGKRYWFAQARFTTGPGRGTPPPAATVMEARAHFAHGGGDCGPGSAFSVSYRPHADPRPGDLLMVVERHAPDRILLRTPLLPATGPSAPRLHFGDLLCTRDKVHLGQDGPFEFRLITESASGQRRTGPGFVRASGKPGLRGLFGGKPRPPVAYQGADEASRWFGAPLEAGRPAVKAGPAGCSTLRSTARVPLGAAGWPWTYEDRASLESTAAPGPAAGAAGLRLVLNRKDATELVEVDPPRRTQRWVGPTGAVAAAAPGGELLVAASRWGKSSAQLEVAAFPASAAVPRWQRVLASPDALNAYPRVATASDRVLVAWRGSAFGGLTRRLRWQVLALGDGSPIGPGGDLSLDDGHPAASFDGQRFLLARGGGRQGPALLARVSLQGQLLDEQELGPPGTSELDLARSGRGSVAVWHHGETISLVRIDDQGRPTGAPTVISQGTPGSPRKPRVAARDDQALVVWEASRARQLVAVMVDGGGRISAPLVLAAGQEARTPAPLAGPGGLAVGYGAGALTGYDGTAPVVERLACESSALSGPPARLATP